MEAIWKPDENAPAPDGSGGAGLARLMRAANP
jgi:hypothetical protein